MKLIWLEKVDSVLPEIRKVVNNCDEPYRQKCFEILLTYALNSDLIQSRSESKKERDEKTLIEESPVVLSNSKFNKYLIDNGISLESINGLIDLNSGDILSNNLGKNSPDITKNIAILISLWHFSKDGEWSFEKNELIKKTKPYGVKFHNHFRDIKKVAFEGKKVFLCDGKICKIPIPSLGYVTKTINELCG
jgi:hypothetical protein